MALRCCSDEIFGPQCGRRVHKRREETKSPHRQELGHGSPRHSILTWFDQTALAPGNVYHDVSTSGARCGPIDLINGMRGLGQ